MPFPGDGAAPHAPSIADVARLRRERVAATLPDLFGADDETFRAVLDTAEWVHLPGGAQLLAQGEPGDSMFVVVTGRLRAFTTTSEGRRVVLGEIRAGECVGEMALLTGQPRTATVQAIRDSSLLRISDGLLHSLAVHHPHLALSTSRVLARRLTASITGHKPDLGVKNVTVLRVTEDPSCARFLEHVLAILAYRGTVLHLTEERFVRELATGSLSEALGDELRMARWCEEQELRHGTILYCSAASAGPWTELCLRQADVVLLFVPFSHARVDEAVQRALARAIARVAARVEIVFVHDPATARPEHTRERLAAWPTARHHHVRATSPEDARRIARFACGDAIGLVLSGGGARGFAHLGVLRAVRERGIPIDAVGGTSIGSIVAALVALGHDDASLRKLFRDELTRRNPIGDYTALPWQALVKGKRLEEVLRRTVGEGDVEDTWIGYFCVSSDLATALAHVHRKGSLWKAIRASVSLPGLLPPVPDGEKLLVDGGLLNNLPIDAMRDSGVGRVVAVDVMVSEDASMKPASSSWFARGSQVLLHRDLNAWSPDIRTILMKSVTLSSHRLAAELRAAADLYLCPDTGGIGLMDWKALDRGIALGYEYARRELEARDLSHLALPSR